MFRNTGANAFAKNQTRLAYEDKRDLYCRGFCQGPELSDEEDCFGSDVGSSVDSSLCIWEQDDLSYADIAYVVDFDS